eukprot:TRINITY_DN25166_c0_g1_i1.p1 TRINITY_DN25166_c0_g1~~TRINITY_DN25166_c0_g1_i1.p1  ORF type:complete len:270 (+),score=59.86 TRINITY_DN25166_c0_g1_i1:103-810(+)
MPPKPCPTLEAVPGEPLCLKKHGLRQLSSEDREMWLLWDEQRGDWAPWEEGIESVRCDGRKGGGTCTVTQAYGKGPPQTWFRCDACDYILCANCHKRGRAAAAKKAAPKRKAASSSPSGAAPAAPAPPKGGPTLPAVAYVSGFPAAWGEPQVRALLEELGVEQIAWLSVQPPRQGAGVVALHVDNLHNTGRLLRLWGHALTEAQGGGQLRVRFGDPPKPAGRAARRQTAGASASK